MTDWKSRALGVIVGVVIGVITANIYFAQDTPEEVSAEQAYLDVARVVVAYDAPDLTDENLLALGHLACGAGGDTDLTRQAGWDIFVENEHDYEYGAKAIASAAWALLCPVE